MSDISESVEHVEEDTKDQNNSSNSVDKGKNKKPDKLIENHEANLEDR